MRTIKCKKNEENTFKTLKISNTKMEPLQEELASKLKEGRVTLYTMVDKK